MAMSVDKAELSENVLRLVNKHWTLLQSGITDEPQQNIIFVIGGPSAGKSTVAQIIAGDLQKLHSKPCEKEDRMCPRPHPKSHFFIKDEQGLIRNFHLDSDTLLPEFLVLDDTTSLVDCPSFDDDTDTTQEIVANVLMKKIVEQVDHAKFLWVISASSLFENVQDSITFTGLFDNAKWFFRNLEKIKDSIGLVITKVRDCDPVAGEAITDEDIFERAEACLQHFSGHAAHKNFVECLLNAKSNWALVRSPTREGSLNTMDHFVQARGQLRKLCQVKLKAAEVTRNDLEWMVFLEYPEWLTQPNHSQDDELSK